MVQPATKLAREPAPEALVRQIEPTVSPPTAAAAAAALAHQIVIVGGGAGGLVLATRLGDRLGRRGRARVTLVDCALTHIWKPLLHEVAAGRWPPTSTGSTISRMRAGIISRSSPAAWRPRPGRAGRSSSTWCDTGGAEIGPRRRLGLRHAGVAVGSSINDFGVPGVARALSRSWTAPREAERIHRLISAASCAATPRPGAAPGGGCASRSSAPARPASSSPPSCATPPASWSATACVASIPTATSSPADRGRPAVLPALPERPRSRPSGSCALGVEVRTAEQVDRVSAEGVIPERPVIPADLIVWTAGVKGPDWLAGLDGLEVDRNNQLVVDATLRTSRDHDISRSATAPPVRAGRRARRCRRAPRPRTSRPMLLARSLARRLDGGRRCRSSTSDYGSLISLSSSTLGKLMGKLIKSITIEGRHRASGLPFAVPEAPAGAARAALGDAGSARQPAAPAHPAAAQAALIGVRAWPRSITSPPI